MLKNVKHVLSNDKVGTKIAENIKRSNNDMINMRKGPREPYMLHISTAIMICEAFLSLFPAFPVKSLTTTSGF